MKSDNKNFLNMGPMKKSWKKKKNGEKEREKKIIKEKHTKDYYAIALRKIKSRARVHKIKNKTRFLFLTGD